MAWSLGSWKRASDAFRLSLGYGDEEKIASPIPILFRNGQPLTRCDPNFPSAGVLDPISLCRFRVQLDWSTGDDEEQVALKLQSQLMVTLPVPQEEAQVQLDVEESGVQSIAITDVGDDPSPTVRVSFTIKKKSEPLKVISVSKNVGSGPPADGSGLLARLLGVGASERPSPISVAEELLGYTPHWQSLVVLNLSGCSLAALPVDLSRLPVLERVYLENNKLSLLPPEIGSLKHLQLLKADHNMLVSVPAELKQCAALVILSLEHNRLVRLLLDFRAMTALRSLHLFGNPLEFFPEILPCTKLRSLSLANVRIDADEALSFVNVHIETENVSYFVASKHKLSAFFALIFRFSSCQHPLLASALAKIAHDNSNRTAIGRDESAVRQLLSMMLSDNSHVVEQACLALSSLASDASLVLRLINADIMQPIESVLRSSSSELLISVLHVVVNLAFSSDAVAARILSKEVLKRLKFLCAHSTSEVQQLALLAVGNLAFCWENRRALVASESLRELLLRLSAAANAAVSKAAIRALAIFGENESLRRAVKGRPVGKQGLCILSMDGGGMRGLATIQMLRRLEQGTGKRVHEMFDLICGTSTGGMLAVALGIKQMTLDQCEEIYKRLGKLVFAEPTLKDNEAATWREKLDQLYKSSSQNFRVVVHGSKHNADEFERLLKEMCANEDGDLLIDSSSVKGTPKIFVVSSLVSVTPAQPFVFRNYQYPAGTPEITPWTTEGPAASVSGTPATATPLKTQIGRRKRGAFIGSCKHRIWEAIRASSAAPYYLDDFSIDTNRWQDGAIVANNPTIIAIREAQLLWPDTRIGCLVSIGCGNIPAKPRGKGGWRYLDTGQVLIESACSVERVEEALDTLLPLFPDIQYFRLNPVDDRCGMELDETDPTVWAKLEAATQEYVEANGAAFQAACDCLVPPLQEDEWSEKSRTVHGQGKRRSSAKGGSDEVGPSLGWRKRVFLTEELGNADIPKFPRHTRSLEAFCARNRIKLEIFCNTSSVSQTAIRATTPLTSPLFTGSFPVSPLLYSPELGLPQLSHLEVVPPLSLDGGQNQVLAGKTSHSPPQSPPLGPRQIFGPVSLLNEKLQSSPQVGIVHLALQSDSIGLILSWRCDVLAVAEPGEPADAFLQSVMASMQFTEGIKSKKGRSFLPKITTVADLVSEFPKFWLGGVLYRFIGRQTQVLDDDKEVGAYLFQRTLPSVHLTSEDIRWMVGAWRERIVICTGKFGLQAALIKAFLDAGAKAVVASSLDSPKEMRTTANDASRGSGNTELPETENGQFVIGDEEEEETVVSSPVSDWEDSDFERAEKRTVTQEVEEKELGSFICDLYSALFKDGVGADVALERALESHPKMHYRCYLPND